jgi:hypothetical protein
MELFHGNFNKEGSVSNPSMTRPVQDSPSHEKFTRGDIVNRREGIYFLVCITPSQRQPGDPNLDKYGFLELTLRPSAIVGQEGSFVIPSFLDCPRENRARTYRRRDHVTLQSDFTPEQVGQYQKLEQYLRVRFSRLQV